MQISKDITTAIKGIVILMMIWGHLFHGNGLKYFDSSYDIWIFNGKPLVDYLSYAMPPVHFYIILSGFGLYKVYEKGLLTWRSQLKRLLKIYIVCWIVLLVFVPVGHYMSCSKFMIDVTHLLGNVTGTVYLYNTSWWFLFPYVLLTLLSPFILTAFQKRPLIWLGGALLLPAISGYIISQSLKFSRYNLDFPINQVVLLAYFQLSFSLGLLLGKYDFQLNKIPRSVCVITIILATFTEIIIKTTASHPFYSLLLTLCFVRLLTNTKIAPIFITLGKYSMPMWLIHYYYIIICPDLIYGFKYPLLIFIALTSVSMISSIVIMKMSNMVYKVI